MAPPVFEDEEKSRAATLLNAIILASLAVIILALPVTLFGGQITGAGKFIAANLAILPTALLVFLILRALLFKGKVYLVAWAVIIINWVSISILIYLRGNLSTFAPFFLVSTTIAAFALGRVASFLSFAFSSLTALVFAILQQRGILPQGVEPTPIGQFVYFFSMALLIVTLIALAQSNILHAIQRARENEAAQKRANQELLALQSSLEQKIAERTADLNQRVSQLQTVSSVARAIVSLQDLNTLLPQITKLVGERFGFYHVGIFLLDEDKEFAVLRAASSEGGRKLLSRQHKLKVDSDTLVGAAIAYDAPRIASDIGEGSALQNIPELSETRSEAVLPLRVSGRVIGALDVHSTEPRTFTVEDLDALTILADQIAIAIENAHLLEETRKALAESRTTFENYVKQEWSHFAKQVRHTGYVFDGKQILPLDSNTKREHEKRTPLTGSLSLKKTPSSLTVPIKLRGQLIGLLDVRSKKGEREWKQDEIAILEAAAERAALALENARLLESSQRRAARERTISDLSARIGAASNIDLIMQTTVEELGRKIGGIAEVTFELEPEEQP